MVVHCTASRLPRALTSPRYTITYIMVSVTMDRPFDDLRNRQQAIARRRKKKKFSLLLSQITVPSPHYNNDVDIRSNTKMMKYVIYSTGKFCRSCLWYARLFGCVCAYLVFTSCAHTTQFVMHHLLIPTSYALMHNKII